MFCFFALKSTQIDHVHRTRMVYTFRIQFCATNSCGVCRGRKWYNTVPLVPSTSTAASARSNPRCQNATLIIQTVSLASSPDDSNAGTSRVPTLSRLENEAKGKQLMLCTVRVCSDYRDERNRKICDYKTWQGQTTMKFRKEGEKYSVYFQNKNDEKHEILSSSSFAEPRCN